MLGLGHHQILFKHLLPNCLPPIIVIAAVQGGQRHLGRGDAEFLELAIPITEPSRLTPNGCDPPAGHTGSAFSPVSC